MTIERRNRELWNAKSDSYQAAHGTSLSERALAWGVWRIPESELHVLDPVEGRDILELGCGAAQFTLALAGAGARAVGIDFAERQLSHVGEAPRRAALVVGSALDLPFPAGSFDTVFCDHGAMSFAPPERALAEASRVLRHGGLLAFCMSTPIRDICWDDGIDGVSSSLAIDYFDLHSLEDEDGTTCYQLPYGDWIRLFRRHSFEVEDLVELQAPEQALTTYSDYVPAEWARRWPSDHIWKVRKISSDPTRRR